MASGGESGQKITALVTVAQEWDLPHLEDCLRSVAFADEILLVDCLESERVWELGDRYADRVLRREHEPAIEMIREKVVDEATHDWLLMLDPDEEVSSELARQIQRLPLSAPVAAFWVPWQFYFAGDRLETTSWGRQDKTKQVLVNRSRVTFRPVSEAGLEVDRGRELHICRAGGNVLKHYWCSGWKEFSEKHLRYVRLAGEARYSDGWRFSVRGFTRRMIEVVAREFLCTGGIRGGLRGWVLSVLAVCVEGGAWISLLRHQWTR